MPRNPSNLILTCQGENLLRINFHIIAEIAGKRRHTSCHNRRIPCLLVPRANTHLSTKSLLHPLLNARTNRHMCIWPDTKLRHKIAPLKGFFLPQLCWFSCGMALGLFGIPSVILGAECPCVCMWLRSHKLYCSNATLPSNTVHLSKHILNSLMSLDYGQTTVGTTLHVVLLAVLEIKNIPCKQPQRNWCLMGHYYSEFS